MRKLRLDLDQLNVQSFSPSPGPAERIGTVRGNEATVATCDTSPECETWVAPTCRYAATCNGVDSCYDTCESCGGSCPGTCYEATRCLACTQ